MYRAIRGGSTTNSEGKTYRFTADKNVEGAKKGELDHCPSVEWVNDKPKKEANSDSEYPIHTGGGYFELSNGEKVRGKEEAIQAQNELDA